MIMKKILMILSAVLLFLCLPMRVHAATEGDVYAALRSIGVPESYVSQAAGILARGTSDGAGVYRGNGTYYSYSAMVSYIYANRETILLYCGIDPETGEAVTTAAGSTGGSDLTSGAPHTGRTGADGSQLPESTDTTEPMTETTTTALETTVTTTTASVRTTVSSRTESFTQTTPQPESKGRMTAAAVCLILAVCAGLGGMAVILRKNGGEQDTDSAESL